MHHLFASESCIFLTHMFYRSLIYAQKNSNWDIDRKLWNRMNEIGFIYRNAKRETCYRLLKNNRVCVCVCVCVCVWRHSRNVYEISSSRECVKFLEDWFLKDIPNHICPNDLDLEFSFSQTDYYTKVKEPYLVNFLLIATERILRCIYFP